MEEINFNHFEDIISDDDSFKADLNGKKNYQSNGALIPQHPIYT